VFRCSVDLGQLESSLFTLLFCSKKCNFSNNNSILFRSLNWSMLCTCFAIIIFMIWVTLCCNEDNNFNNSVFSMLDFGV
jgi:hypothetical protein